MNSTNWSVESQMWSQNWQIRPRPSWNISSDPMGWQSPEPIPFHCCHRVRKRPWLSLASATASWEHAKERIWNGSSSTSFSTSCLWLSPDLSFVLKKELAKLQFWLCLGSRFSILSNAGDGWLHWMMLSNKSPFLCACQMNECQWLASCCQRKENSWSSQEDTELLQGTRSWRNKHAQDDARKSRLWMIA